MQWSKLRAEEIWAGPGVECRGGDVSEMFIWGKPLDMVIDWAWEVRECPVMSFVPGLYVLLTNQISCRCTPCLKSLLAAALLGEGLASGYGLGPPERPVVTVRKRSTDFAFCLCSLDFRCGSLVDRRVSASESRLTPFPPVIPNWARKNTGQ